MFSTSNSKIFTAARCMPINYKKMDKPETGMSTIRILFKPKWGCHYLPARREPEKWWEKDLNTVE